MFHYLSVENLGPTASDRGFHRTQVSPQCILSENGEFLKSLLRNSFHLIVGERPVSSIHSK